MDVKEQLKQIRKYDEEIESKIELIQRLRAKGEKCTSVISDEPRTSGTSDKTSIIDKRIDLENRLGERVKELYVMIDWAEKEIASLEDSLQRTILTEYYLKRRTWEEVAVKLGYSFQHTHFIHGQAIKTLRNKTSDKI